jgi:H+/gluconate symporter-like permease
MVTPTLKLLMPIRHGQSTTHCTMPPQSPAINLQIRRLAVKRAKKY